VIQIVSPTAESIEPVREVIRDTAIELTIEFSSSLQASKEFKSGGQSATGE
jgi:hypothetical protein